MPAPLLCCIFFLLLTRFVSASRCPRCRAVAVKPSCLSPCRGCIRDLPMLGVCCWLSPCGNQFLVWKGALRSSLQSWERCCGSSSTLGSDLGRVSEVGLLSFGVSNARVWGLALPTWVLEQDGVVFWESLGSS